MPKYRERVQKVYLITSPNSIAGIYDTWAECQAAKAGVRDPCYQSVASREIAEAMLEGTGVSLAPGRYAFTDGNAVGGVGVVLVEERDDDSRSWIETSTTARSVFLPERLPQLESDAIIADMLRRKRNEFAELAALYHVLRHAEPSNSFTIVYDYEGVAAYLDGRWKVGLVVESVVSAVNRLLQTRWPERPTFRHQPGHQSTRCGRDDFAHWNSLADKLATQGAEPSFRAERAGSGRPG